MPLVADLTARRPPFEVQAAFAVDDGETLAILGPNGAGKTTIVDALAGLIPLADGRIDLDERPIHVLPPERRGIGVAFQEAALFPHLSARENVAFPLRARGRRRVDAHRRADGLLKRIAPGVDPAARADRLSGGERQTVALARALACEPRLLLLDEPLAAVDVGARAELRTLLRREIAAFGGPCVLIAHDPVDALTLADRVAILERGRIVQVGTPADIRREPRSAYAADLVGVNLFTGRLVPADHGAGMLETPEGAITVAWPEDLPRVATDHVLATLRPIDVALHTAEPEGSPRNVVRGSIEEVAIHGERARVRLASAPPITAEVTLGSVERMALRRGTTVFASFKAVEVRLMVGTPRPDTL